MSKRKFIKLRTYPGRTIHDMKFFIAACLTKTTNEIVPHVCIYDAPHTNVQEMLIIATFFCF